MEWLYPETGTTTLILTNYFTKKIIYDHIYVLAWFQSRDPTWMMRRQTPFWCPWNGGPYDASKASSGTYYVVSAHDEYCNASCRKPGNPMQNQQKNPRPILQKLLWKAEIAALLSRGSVSPAWQADLYHSGTDGVRHGTGTVSAPEIHPQEKSEKHSGVKRTQKLSRK